jgi:serine/threonine-protein kinase RsbW
MIVADGPRAMEVRFRFHTDAGRISIAVDRIMRLVELSECVPGKEIEVELALREALINAMVHGNRMDPDKWVHVRCRCEPGNGVSIVVGDEGQGFDPIGTPDPAAAEGFRSEGRGISIMRSYMDEVSFENGGTEVHLRKRVSLRARGIERASRRSGREPFVRGPLSDGTTPVTTTCP